MKTHGLEENTLVVFTTDHGVEGSRDKWTLYDPGLNVHLSVTGPGITAGRVHEGLVSLVDLTPTLLDAAGISAPENIQGKSFLACCRGREVSIREVTFAHFGPSRCVRSPEWKLIKHHQPMQAHAFPGKIGGKKIDLPVVELYDLVNDPLEIRNLAEDPRYHDVKSRLDDLLRGWIRENEKVSCGAGSAVQG